MAGPGRPFERRLTDAERLAFASQVVVWKAEGCTNRVMAERFGMHKAAVESRMNKPWFKRIMAEMEAKKRQREDLDPEVQALAGARKKIINLMSGPGIEFLESCLKKDAAGKFVSRGDARYAVDRMMPATGLNEAEDSRRRLGDIKLGVIMAQMEAIRKSDAVFHKQAAVTVEALPAPVARAPELEGEDEGNDLDEVGMPESPSPVPPE